jgi:hypothetical protein
MLYVRCAVLALAACGSPSAGVDGAPANDAAPDGPVHVDDGTPMRRACTNNFGSALSATYGRLDGLLVAIVPPGNGGCNADTDHVHLQVLANNAVYDVAVTVGSTGGVDDVHTFTFDHGMPGPTWAEGWHTGVLNDYVSLGVHSPMLALESRTQLTSDLMADLATVNHISVLATGYGPDGVHLVHRNGSGHDGAIITQPLSTPSHLRLFSFTNQAF